MISSPTNLQPYKSPLNKGIPKGRWQYGSKNMKICICKCSREEIARDRDGKGQMTGRNSAPSEYLLSLPGTRPLSARYLSATCSVRNRTNTEQVMHMCRTRTMANRCLLLEYFDDLRLSPHFTLAELTKTSVKTKDGCFAEIDRSIS